MKRQTKKTGFRFCGLKNIFYGLLIFGGLLIFAINVMGADVASASCSNSLIESAGPCIITSLIASDYDLLFGDNTNITWNITNVGSKDSDSMVADHIVPRGLSVYYFTLSVFFTHNVYGIMDITDNITIVHDSDGTCTPEDIHLAFEGQKPIVCAREIDIPYLPFPETHVYFNLGALGGTGGAEGAYTGESLGFKYEAYLREKDVNLDWLIKSDLNMTASMLECIKTGDKTIDGKLDNAISHLEKSMNANGSKVFDEGKKAVNELVSLVNEKNTPQAVKNACRLAIEKLVAFYEHLAYIAIEDAIDAGGKQKEIYNAQEDMLKAQEEYTKGQYDKAIDQYKMAWEHAQKAMN